jgi:predicted ferric reductase
LLSADRSAAALALAAIGVGGLAVLGLWWQDTTFVYGFGDWLTNAGRITGLLAGYVVAVALVLMARVPWLEHRVGTDRLARWHAMGGRYLVSLAVAHTLLIIWGYAVTAHTNVVAETGTLVLSYPDVLMATVAVGLLVAVGVVSARAARRRLRYETWHFLHLYAYLGIALAFSHQLATGTEFVGRPLARAYWYALYLVTLGALVVFRLVVPVVRSWRLRLRVARVVEEAPGVISLEIEGERLERLRARAGQFFSWRFLTRDRWWEAHPFSLSAVPDGHRLRITVKALGDYTARLEEIPPGTRVIAEGPFGAFTAAARRRPRVALIGGGVGIAPIRALLEDMPGGPGDIAVVYRAPRPDDVILRAELDELARRRGAEVHYLLGPREADDLLAVVPDIAARDVYVCGPPAMTDAVRAGLRRAGVPRRQIFTERFAF